ncbi:hypothetical protein MIDIC_10042 [Alphaproteobacteria bacterium]
MLRGFKDDSYVSTAKFLQKIIEKTDYGVVINPEAFKEFKVTHVPTFIIAEQRTECVESQSCIPAKYHKISGNIGFEYVLTSFYQKGLAK